MNANMQQLLNLFSMYMHALVVRYIIWALWWDAQEPFQETLPPQKVSQIIGKQLSNLWKINTTREALSLAYRVLDDEGKGIDLRTFMLFMYEYNPRIRKNKITNNYYYYQPHIALIFIFIFDEKL